MWVQLKLQKLSQALPLFDEYRSAQKALAKCEAEMEERVEWFKSQNMLIEAQRIEERTKYDLEMLREVGYCSGVENYSRVLSDRAPKSPPYTLFDYFPEEYYDRMLFQKDKDELAARLSMTNEDNRPIKWPTIKKKLTKDGLVIQEGRVKNLRYARILRSSAA